MKTKGKEDSANQLRLELKYCECCGGLWLRPTGGGQLYCVACSRAMDAMPPASCDRLGAPRMPKGPRSVLDSHEFDSYDDDDDDLDLKAMGGVA